MCNKNVQQPPSDSSIESTFPYKNYSLDNVGNIVTSEMYIDDFQLASDCAECHQTHFEEWYRSPHANSNTNSFFKNCLNDTKNEFGDNFENFCQQCHNPIKILASSNSEYLSSHEGISCDVCHSMTRISSGTIAHPSQLVTSQLFINPGEGIKYGSMENPETNTYHESQFNPIFKQSQICLPCHDLRNEDVETEITFTEWNSIPEMAMSGAISCQQCHMPEKEDGTHEHHFVGVDVNYEFPAEEDPQYYDVLNLIQTSATLTFENNLGALSDSILRDSVINLPIRVISNTGHHLPSGTSFNRECWISVEIRSENSNGEFIYQNGVLENDLQLLDYYGMKILLIC